MTTWGRFAAWYYIREGKPPSAAHDAIDHAAWTAWQAAEKATAARCAEIADRIAVDYHAKYRGLPGADGIRRGGTYAPHDDGISDGADIACEAIRAEYPEAFTSDPPAKRATPFP